MPIGRRTRGFGAFSLLALAGSLASSADAAPLVTSWTAPAGCPSRETVERAVLAAAKAPVGTEPVADAVVLERRARWHATVRTREGGVRELDASSCAELADAVIVVLSLLLEERSAEALAPPPLPASSPLPLPPPPPAPSDPLDTVPPDSAPPDPAPPDLAPEVAAPSEAPPEEPADEEEQRPPPSVEPARIALPPTRLARAAFGVGITGEAIELGAHASIASYVDLLGVEASLAYSTPPAGMQGEQEITVELDSVAAAVAGCARLPAAPSLSLCAGPRLEWLSASAPEVAAPESDALFLFGAFAGARLRTPESGRFALFLGAEGVVRFSPVRMEVEPFGLILELPRLAGRALIGSEVTF